MNSLKIKIEIEGQPVALKYEHQKSALGEWYASIVDEYKTIEENFSGLSPEDCLDAAIHFAIQLGSITGVTAFEDGNPYLSLAQRRIQKASRLKYSY